MERAGVAVGTAGWVINGLKAAKVILNKGEKTVRRLVNYRKLLERWVEAWPENPKQGMYEFIAEDPYWWKMIDIQKYAGFRGDEIAGAKYTNYPNPVIATV